MPFIAAIDTPSYVSIQIRSEQRKDLTLFHLMHYLEEDNLHPNNPKLSITAAIAEKYFFDEHGALYLNPWVTERVFDANPISRAKFFALRIAVVKPR